MTASDVLFHSSFSGSEPGHDQDIRDLIIELRDAQTSLESAPTILDIVNDLSIACDDLFSQGSKIPESFIDDENMSHLSEAHAEFLKTFALFAEDIRATNGEVREEFFTFLDSGPLRGLRLAA